MFVNERILQLRHKLQRGYLILLALYAPEEGKLNKLKDFMNFLRSVRQNK
jgi:hypothetical protein